VAGDDGAGSRTHPVQAGGKDPEESADAGGTGIAQHRQAYCGAEYDIGDVATCFEYYGGLANKVNGSVMPVPANALSFTLREPMGVAGQIIP